MTEEKEEQRTYLGVAYLPYEVGLHGFSQTQERSSCRSPSLHTRCREARHGNRQRYACSLNNRMFHGPTRAPDVQRVKDLSTFHAVQHERSSTADAAACRSMDLTFAEVPSLNFPFVWRIFASGIRIRESEHASDSRLVRLLYLKIDCLGAYNYEIVRYILALGESSLH